MPCLKLSIFKVFFCHPSLSAYQATIISTKLIPHTCPTLWTCVVLMWLYCRPQISKPKLWINPGPLPILSQIECYWNRATSTCLCTIWLFHAIAVVAVEIVWPTKPKFFIIWLFTEKKKRSVSLPVHYLNPLLVVLSCHLIYKRALKWLC